jgi:hypothetical protein
VGQLLKHVYGCKVIGSAGSNDKVIGVHLQAAPDDYYVLAVCVAATLPIQVACSCIFHYVQGVMRRVCCNSCCTHALQLRCLLHCFSRS